MKILLPVVLISIALCSCKKNADSIQPTKQLNDKNRIGGVAVAIVQVGTSDTYNFSVTESDPISGAPVMQKDTEVSGNFVFEFYPHLGNMVHEEVKVPVGLEGRFSLIVGDDGYVVDNLTTGLTYQFVDF